MLRKATISDIPAIYSLIKIIWKDMSFPLLHLVNEKLFKKLMIQAMTNNIGKFGFENAYVYTSNNNICGVLFAYFGKHEIAFNKAFNQFITQHICTITDSDLFSERETADNELYIDSLVVSAHYRNQGIGTQLLRDFLNQFDNNKLPITLNCDTLNPKEKKLYKSLGFQTTDHFSFLGHQYDHMTYTTID